MSQATSKTSPQVAPRWPRRLLSSDQHSKEHWPGGVKIKMTLGIAKTQGKRAQVANGKTKVGPCWRSFIQSELLRGSHKSPNRVRNAKSRNITPVSRKLGRQEWNKSPGIRPSLPPFTKYIRCINLNRRYCDIPKYPCSDQEQTSSSPATNNAIRGAEQKR